MKLIKQIIEKIKSISKSALTRIKSIKFDKRLISVGVAALIGAALISLAIFVFVNAFSPDEEWTTSLAGGDSGTVLSLYPDMSAESEAEHYGSASTDTPEKDASSKIVLKPDPSR